MASDSTSKTGKVKAGSTLGKGRILARGAHFSQVNGATIVARQPSASTPWRLSLLGRPTVC